MRDLRLAVKREYFEPINDGSKPFEYRLKNDFWIKRLVGKKYDTVTITLGYPKKGDMSRQVTFPYNGYVIQNITHKHFHGGTKAVEVFAIILRKDTADGR